MPRYDYTCTECDWKGERSAPMAERDDQTCDNEVDVEVIEDVNDDTGETTTRTVRDKCGAPLTREEIPLNQGRMNHNWSMWQT